MDRARISGVVVNPPERSDRWVVSPTLTVIADGRGGFLEVWRRPFHVEQPAEVAS